MPSTFNREVEHPALGPEPLPKMPDQSDQVPQPAPPAPEVTPTPVLDESPQEQPLPTEPVPVSEPTPRRRPFSKTVAPSAPVSPAVPTEKSDTRKEIEQLLSTNLTELYQTMSPQEQARFRAKGDEVSSALEQLVRTFTATTKRVLELIRSWLATIPRVNKYFLEQESKLKTDDIMKYQRKKKEEDHNNIAGL